MEKWLEIIRTAPLFQENGPKLALRYKVMLAVLGLAALVALFALLIRGHNLEVLNAAGIIARQERSLMYLTLALSVLVVVPVFAMAFGIAWRYRAGNKKADYRPDFDHHALAETLWWGLPTIVILVLSVMAWKSSHELDPFRPIPSTVAPLTVQVVALDWKWLFIYPQQHIATVNYLQIPAGTPVNFQITSDAPMNSFWIPQLGGQIYAMPGMVTRLSLEADAPGTYRGVSANISGAGFAGMDFAVKSTSQADFGQWVSGVQQSSAPLDPTAYQSLRAPSSNQAPSFYTAGDAGLYDAEVMKYMMPGTQ